MYSCVEIWVFLKSDHATVEPMLKYSYFSEDIIVDKKCEFQKQHFF